MQVDFGRVDAEKEKTLVTEDDVSTLPTLVVYVRGRRVHFTGPHTHDAVVTFIQKLLAPAFHVVSDLPSLTTRLQQLAAQFQRQPFVTVRLPVTLTLHTCASPQVVCRCRSSSHCLIRRAMGDVLAPQVLGSFDDDADSDEFIDFKQLSKDLAAVVRFGCTQSRRVTFVCGNADRACVAWVALS